jgi:hypothetical protein
VRISESPDHLNHVLVKNYPSSLSAKEHVDHKGPLSFFVTREHLMDLDFEAIEVRASEARQNRDARRSKRTTKKILYNSCVYPKHHEIHESITSRIIIDEAPGSLQPDSKSISQKKKLENHEPHVLSSRFVKN